MDGGYINEPLNLYTDSITDPKTSVIIRFQCINSLNSDNDEDENDKIIKIVKQIRVLSTNLEEIQIIGDNDLRLGFIFAIFHVHVQPSFL